MGSNFIHQSPHKKQEEIEIDLYGKPLYLLTINEMDTLFKEMNEKQIKLVSEILEVEKEIVESWRDKFQIVNYKIGELILNTNSTSKSILLLIDGKIRLRGILKNK